MQRTHKQCVCGTGSCVPLHPSSMHCRGPDPLASGCCFDAAALLSSLLQQQGGSAKQRARERQKLIQLGLRHIFLPQGQQLDSGAATPLTEDNWLQYPGEEACSVSTTLLVSLNRPTVLAMRLCNRGNNANDEISETCCLFLNYKYEPGFTAKQAPFQSNRKRKSIVVS